MINEKDFEKLMDRVTKFRLNYRNRETKEYIRFCAKWDRIRKLQKDECKCLNEEDVIATLAEIIPGFTEPVKVILDSDDANKLMDYTQKVYEIKCNENDELVESGKIAFTKWNIIDSNLLSIRHMLLSTIQECLEKETPTEIDECYIESQFEQIIDMDADE